MNEDLVHNRTGYPKYITVTGYEWQPQIWVNKTKGNGLKIWGPMADILYYLERSLHISINLIRPKDEASGTYNASTNDWSGMMGVLHRKEVDMSVTPLLMSEQRMQFVKFTLPVFIGNIKILVGRPEPKKTSFDLYSAFEIEVWLVFFLAFFSVAFMKFLQRPCVPKMSKKMVTKLSTVERLVEETFFTFAALLNQGEFRYIPRMLSGRIMGGIWAYCAIVTMNFYSAKMTSVMAIQKSVPFIEKIEDFPRHPEVQPILHRGSNEVDYFKNSKTNPQAKIWKKIKEKDMMHASKLYDEERLDLIEAGKAGVFQEWRVFKISLAKRYLAKKKCRFYATEPYRIVPVSLGFTMDINKAFLEDVNKAVCVFLEGNLIDYLYPPTSESLFQRCISDDGVPSVWTSLAISDVWSIMVLHFLGNCLSMSTLLIEFFVYFNYNTIKEKHLPIFYIIMNGELALKRVLIACINQFIIISSAFKNVL